ncbi:MAG: YeeE/YedE thiosulfate transporter family protein [Methanoregula sp.]|nr:YeeE/YedE thiosulfate transporter family protein [Methanoregula sp.]
MLAALHQNKKAQVVIGLFVGIFFGFLLQKSGVTYYDVVIGQLLLTDFTVLKMMLSAVIVGMIGFHLLKRVGLARLHAVTGSIGSNLIGGLVFGVGFALLGYCPGTVAGGAGQGALDAVFGGISGILIGSALFATFYSSLNAHILKKGKFANITLPHLLGVNEWVVVVPAVLLSIAALGLLEYYGV